jgi:hypothetical protein
VSLNLSRKSLKHFQNVYSDVRITLKHYCHVLSWCHCYNICQEGGLFICIKKYVIIDFQHALMYSVCNILVIVWICVDCLANLPYNVRYLCSVHFYSINHTLLTLKPEILRVHYNDWPENNHCLFWEPYKTHE